jgi:hypothetical protein
MTTSSRPPLLPRRRNSIRPAATIFIFTVVAAGAVALARPAPLPLPTVSPTSPASPSLSPSGKSLPAALPTSIAGSTISYDGEGPLFSGSLPPGVIDVIRALDPHATEVIGRTTPKAGPSSPPASAVPEISGVVAVHFVGGQKADARSKVAVAMADPAVTGKPQGTGTTAIVGGKEVAILSRGDVTYSIYLYATGDWLVIFSSSSPDLASEYLRALP